MQYIEFSSRRAGEQVLLERLLTEVHPAMFNLSSFWRQKIDESTSSKLSQLLSKLSSFHFKFGETDIFGHTINFLEPVRSNLSKFDKCCKNI
jgi:hypothetical protein